MSDRMTPLSFSQLMDWLLGEYRQDGSIFGVHTLARLPLDDTRILPIGPAAGPHTQMAQNIIAAYAAGARYFELKTVQTLDGADLQVEKPCILAADAGYNSEWSTELTVVQALDEYVKAWYALKLISKSFELGNPNAFAFNMSVGYNLDGISSPKIDAFIEGLKDASTLPVWQECRRYAESNLSRLPGITPDYLTNLSPIVSDSVTVSTLHGCPPEEIQKIALYLLCEKKINTRIKCNPTLAGFDFAKAAFAVHGYPLAFDPYHFDHDLQLFDALELLEVLLSAARTENRHFGVKLTNTFPVKNVDKNITGGDVYLSGKPLFPLSVRVAELLSARFGAQLPISFSGGADFYNLESLLGAGISPVTASTTLLKPGGYQRLYQLSQIAQAAIPVPPDAAKIKALSAAALTDSYYDRCENAQPVKRGMLPLLNCYKAPCRMGDKAKPPVPQMLRLTEEGRLSEARALAQEVLACDAAACEEVCIRRFYEQPVQIAKLALTLDKSAQEAIPATPRSPHEKLGTLSFPQTFPEEAARCLNCEQVCELCVQVCPNRANVAVHLPGQQKRQILHLDALCNHCGNCTAFCPYEGSPHTGKFTLYRTKTEFAAGSNPGFWKSKGQDGETYIRLYQGIVKEADGKIPAAYLRLAHLPQEQYPWLANFV